MEQLKVQDLLDFFEEYAPSGLKESYDNVGLLVGDHKAAVNKVIVSLELNDALIDEAVNHGYDTIVVHHPLIFKPLSKVVTSNPISSRVITLIKNEISLIALHTNLDRTVDGLNDYICDLLGVEVTNMESVNEQEDSQLEIPLIRVGKIDEMPIRIFVEKIKKVLSLEYVHVAGDTTKMIKTVGICTGSGMSFYKDAIRYGVDCYLTGDMKYHDATLASDTGVPIIDGTHYGTERIVSELLRERMKDRFGDQIYIDRFEFDNPIKVL